VTKKITRRRVAAGLAGSGIAAALSPALAKKAAGKSPPRYDTANGEWRTYGGDQKSLRYSPLHQIDAANFSRMQMAWSFAEPGDNNLQATPLMVNGVVYLTAGIKRSAIALDGRTGQLLWRFDFDEGKRGNNAPRPGSGHGVSYWTDGHEERILYVTIGYQLICLDAKTGKPVASFGQTGVVDLKQNDDQDINLDGDGVGEEIGLHSTPLVVGDVIVVGAAHAGTTSSKKHVKGYVRGFDIRSGKRLWIFHTVPKKNEAGYETWLDGSAEYVGNTGNWAQNSADPELGLVYLSIEQPTDDYYGGFRPGTNLFADCIVAVDAKTGKRRWYYQTVHHDMWDRDNMCAPVLCDITVNGRKIKALAQASKQAYLYVLDRTNGKPVWPIPEMPVPQGNVPGEWYSPTQPMPTKPPAFDVQGVSIDDLIDFTPALRAEAEKLVTNYIIGPLYQTPSISKYPAPIATIQNPANDGAAQWPGGALDPETNIYYVFSNMSYAVHGLLPGDPSRTDLGVVWGIATETGTQAALLAPSEQPTRAADAQIPAGAPATPGRPGAAAAPGRAGRGNAGGGRLTVQGLPLLKPPYGRITAIDLNKGEILWQVPHGETPDEVRSNPALAGMTIARTGSQGKVGTLITKTLVIAGDGTATTGPDGKTGAWLRAYDKMTGRELGSVRMPTRVTGSPMTYALDGQQYIAVPLSGPGVAAQLAVYRLPV
jgi:quinoprotein glucose dehydrogenase